MEYSYLSLLPVITVLCIAFISRKVITALVCGILLGIGVLSFSDGGLLKGFNCLSIVLTEGWSLNSLIFCLLLGAFVYVIEASGGVRGMVHFLTSKKRLVNSGFTAQILTYIIGLVVFMDGISSIVVAGVTGRHLFDEFNISRKRLAYIIDSTSSPVAWLVPINAAGAFLIAMINGLNLNIANPLSIIIETIPFQIYGISSVVVVGISILIGPENIFSKSSKVPVKEVVKKHNTINSDESRGEMKNMLYPLLSLVSIDFLSMMVTGNGSIMRGDAIVSLMFSALVTLILTGFFYRAQNITDWSSYLRWCYKGMRSFWNIIVMLALAFAMSNIIKVLGTGVFIASLISDVNLYYLPLMVFLFGVIISFSTGTSGGTAAILMPIVIPLAIHLNIPVPIVLGAIISGAVFGDHCSPISESTILASMIAEVPLMEHVRNQIPYAVVSGVVAAIGFLYIGFTFLN